jgi:hypothetical protein
MPAAANFLGAPPLDGRPYRPDGLPCRLLGSAPGVISLARPSLCPSGSTLPDGRSAQPPMIAAAAATNRHHDFIYDSRSRDQRGSRFCRASNGATRRLPCPRGRGTLAKAQKGEDRSNDYDQTHYVDDGVHGPSPKHAARERETSPSNAVSACRSRRGGRDCRAGRRGDGGGLLCRGGRSWLLDPLGSKRAGRRGGEQANQNRYAHGGSLPSRCTATRQRVAVAAKPRP